MVGIVFKGCRQIDDTAFAFNDLAHTVGMSPDINFVDITDFVLSSAVSPSIVPPCHAIIFAVAATRGQNRAVGGSSNDAAATGLLRLTQDIRQIPDVYAFLHAVFNCGLEDAMQPGSIIDKLRLDCSNTSFRDRSNVLKRASDLQLAYTKIVTNAVWGEPLPKPMGAVTASSVPPGAPMNSPPQYFVFVRAPEAAKVVLIEGNQITEIEDDGTPDDEHRNGVLTAGVLTKIVSIYQEKAKEESYSVIGLFTQQC